MRVKGEARLDKALHALASALESARAQWMVIGGIAVIARGVRRLTTDIDAVVRGDSVDVESLLVTLAKHGIRPRIKDALAFARENLVLLLRHSASAVELDLSLGFTAFEHEAIAANTKAAYGRQSFPMARPEDLIVFKALAARPKDIEDAASLLLMHRDIDLKRVRRRLGELAALAEEPSLLEGLARVLGQVREARLGATRIHSKKRKQKRRPVRKK